MSLPPPQLPQPSKRTPEELKKRERFLTYVVVVIVVAAAVLAVLIPSLYLAYFRSVEGGAPTGSPAASLNAVSSFRGGQVTVTSVDSLRPLNSYRFSLFMSDVPVFIDEELRDGFPLWDPNGQIVFQDNDASGTLSQGDRFALSQLTPSTDYVFILKWEPTGEELDQAVLVPQP